MPEALAPSLTLTMPEPDVALLTFDTPDKGANILSTTVLDEFEQHFATLSEQTDLAGLIIASGKPGGFIAGADIREFAASLDIAEEQSEQMCLRGQGLFSQLSKMPFVTVAAIDGICVGGGAELAVWCDRRVVSRNEKTQFGFPEVKLGLFPGWGGTARTPRMIGLSNAVELITGGDSLDADAAIAIGVANDIVEPDQLIATAIGWIREEQRTKRYLDDRERWGQGISMSETELGFLGVTASAYIRQQTKGQYPAPEAALEAMLESAGADIDNACKIEAKGVSQLFGSPINAALINVFLITDRNKKDSGVAGETKPSNISQVGVLGAGIMGAGIAAANLRRGVIVDLTDASREALENGAQLALTEAAFDRSVKGPDSKRLVQTAPKLNLVSSEELEDCDLIVEAIVENAAVKKQVFKRLEPNMRDDAILASNTSTIPISSLAEGLKRPDRFCGIHFFNPVRRMKLVEVIRGRETSDETTATAVAYAKRLGKMPIVINDGPGFLVNRLLLPYMNEALELLRDGAAMRDIERAATKFGMPMGPLTLYDMVGIDTACYAGRTMWEAYPKRIVASPVLPGMVKAGRFGQKSGQGFYSYENPKKERRDDPEFTEFFAPYLREPKPVTPEILQDRMFLTMFLEATRALEEGIVRDVRDIDLGLIYGIGFPPFRGGLMFWADSIGAKAIVERLKPLEELGERAKPTDLLLEMAKDGRKFYELSS